MSLLTGLKYNLHKKKLVYTGQRKVLNAEILPMNDPIDFVVTWVDGSDPAWLAENEKYKIKCGIKEEKDAHGKCRYRDWDYFRYWFRAVEKYAPWVNNVYLVTCGQVPEWLNLNAPKLKLINHKDYIPKQYLPTFNSIPIELNLHKIEGLCEHFVYFNDDMLLGRPIEPEDFFRNGSPNYTAVAQPLMKSGSNDMFSHVQFSTMAAVNSAFASKVSERMEAYPEKWFAKEYGDYHVQCNLRAFDQNYLPGMLFPHLGVAYKKSTMEKVWNTIPEQLHKTCLDKFRTPTDIMHQIFSIWAMLQGDFNPVSRDHHGRVFSAVVSEQDDIINAIVNQSYRMICINDSELVTDEDYESLNQAIVEAYKKVFSEKSQYEK